jgi:hypothetical protein
MDQDFSNITIQFDCAGSTSVDFIGTIDDKSGRLYARGFLLGAFVELTGTVTSDSATMDGEWRSDDDVGGTFIATHTVFLPTATPLPTRSAPVDVTGTWHVSFFVIVSGECDLIIEQQGDVLIAVAECDIVGQLELDGEIDQSTGKFQMADPAWVELHGVVSEDGSSVEGALSALGLPGTFSAERDDSIEQVDLSGGWRLAFQGDSEAECSLQMEHAFFNATGELDCPDRDAITMTGYASPLTGAFALDADTSFSELSGDGATAEGYMTGYWLDLEDGLGSFVALRTEEVRPVFLLECGTEDGSAGFQTSCNFNRGASFSALLYLLFPPPDGYSGFDALIGWQGTPLVAEGAVSISCDPYLPTVGPGSLRIDCPAFPDGVRTGPVALADIGFTCDAIGSATLDLAGTTVLDDAGLAIEPLLIGSSIGCYPPAQGGPGPPAGDASCDGSVNSIDAALVLQYDAHLVPLNGCLSGADLNRDDTVNSIDASIILQCSAGLTDMCG